MKKNLILSVTLTLLLSASSGVFSQGIGINKNGLPAASSAMLDVSDTASGLLVPRMTDAQRNNIANPVNGLLIFNITTNCFNFYRNGNWFEMCGSCLAPPSPVTASNSPLCEGNTLQLTASSIPNATYYWTGPNGFTSNLQNPVISNAQAINSGTYYCTATVNVCASAASSVGVNIQSLPSTAYSVSPSPVIENQASVFTAAVSGAVYSWTFQGGTPATSAMQNPSVTWSTSGTKTVGLTVTLNGCSASATTTITVNPATVNKRAFVSSTKYNGNLGGLTGADNLCQARANAAGLGGSWKAWLSDGTTSAASRLNHPSGQILAVNGTLIANNWTNLLAGGVHNLNIDEFGNTVSPEPGGSGYQCSWAGGYFLFAWTNTSNSSGNIWGSNHCSNWSTNSSSLYGATDYIYNVTTVWSTNFAESCFSCTQMNRLMCFEQ